MRVKLFFSFFARASYLFSFFLRLRPTRKSRIFGEKFRKLLLLWRGRMSDVGTEEEVEDEKEGQSQT